MKMTGDVSLRPEQLAHSASSLLFNAPSNVEGKSVPTRAGTDVTGSHHRPLRVLVIEDHKSVLEVIAKCLRLSGFDVDGAEDGLTGLAKALENRHDVVLLDWRLPKKTGADVLRGMRIGGVQVPVVVITSFAPEGAFDAGALGAVRYLSKPLDFTKLPGDVRNAASADQRPSSPSAPVFSPCPIGESVRLGELRRTLHRLEVASKEHRSRAPRSVVHTLARALSRALVGDDVTVFEFAALAKALHLVRDRGTPKFIETMRQVQDLLDHAIRRSTQPLNPRLAYALDHLAAAGPGWAGVRESIVADGLQIDRSTLVRVIEHELGLTFVACRSLVVIRRAVLDLARSSEAVQQIAYRLGFTSASVLNHRFQKFLGLTPTGLRKIIRER